MLFNSSGGIALQVPTPLMGKVAHESASAFPPKKEVRKVKGLAAALVCAVVLYSVDAYFYDGWYVTRIATLLSQIYVHFR